MQIQQPGPNRTGFTLHVLCLQAHVQVLFGVLINHLPLPPEIAFDFARALLRKAADLDSGPLVEADSTISVQVYEGKVLVETVVPVSEWSLRPSAAKELAYRLLECAAKAVGRPLS